MAARADAPNVGGEWDWNRLAWRDALRTLLATLLFVEGKCVMAFIKVTAEELSQLSSQLSGVASSIQGESDGARGQVQAVVGAGWEGAASGQFNALFEQWNTSSKQLIEALTGISQLLGQAGTAYADTESQITRSFG